jgi:hypothetical protein
MSHPATQQLGMQLAQQNAQQQQWEQALGGGQPGSAPQGSAPAGGDMPMGGAPAAPQAGGILAGTGISPQDAKASLMSDPTGKQLMEKVLAARAKNNEFITQREGDVLRRNPDGSVTSVFSSPRMEPGMLPQRGPGGQVTGAAPIPGYAPGVASIKGAEAGAVSGAQAQNDMVTVNTPKGPRMMTRAAAAQMAGGAQPASPVAGPGMSPAVPQPAGPNPNNFGNLRPVGANTGFQQFATPEEGVAALDKNLQAYGKQGINTVAGVISKWAPPNENNTQAYIADVSQRLGIKPDQPLDMGNPMVRQALGSAIAIHEQGPQRLFGARPAPQAQGSGIPLQSDEQKAYGQARAKDFATQAASLADQGQKAGTMNRQLAELERLYQDPNIAKGGAAESISGMKNLAESFGVDVKGLGGEQAVSAITNKMALDLRSTGEGGGMPGAMSDSDRNFLANMTPNLSKSPEGRKLIIETNRKMVQRQIELAKMATAYEQKNGQIDVGFQKEMQDYSSANPLFNGMAAPQRRESDKNPPKVIDFNSLPKKQ